MSLRCPIPKDIRELLANDPFMARCICEGEKCDGRIEWNHALTYAGKRINERYAILPMCSRHHKEQAAYRGQQEAAIRARLRHFNAEEEFRAKYPKQSLI